MSAGRCGGWAGYGGSGSLIRLGALVALVAEVTSQNWRDDYGKKLKEYARRGVEAGVIVDAERRRIAAYRRPDVVEGRYFEEVAYGAGEAAGLETLGGCALPADAVLAGEFAEDLTQADLERLRAEQAAEARAREAEARAEAERQAQQALLE